MFDCSAVMRRLTTFLYADDTAGTAIDFMMERHMGMVPVIDRENKFVGMLSGDRLVHFLLPHSLLAIRNVSANFLRESREELQERLEDLRAKPIGEIVDSDVVTAHPDTPLIEALTLMDHHQYVVPVVEEDGTLVGAVSFFTLMGALGQAGESE